MENDINKLRLLKAYLKSKNKNNIINTFLSISLPILSALIISSLAQDHFIGRLVFSPSDGLEILDKDAVALIKYIVMIFLILIFIGITLYETYRGQRRSALLEEIIDVSIKKLSM